MASEQTDSTPPRASTDWRDLTDGLPQPLDAAEREDMLWQQLLAEFGWYNRAARKHRMAYQGLKILSILLGGLVTVLAAVGAEAWLTAGLAAMIVAAEGFQQLFRLHPNWISCRSTAEALRRQAFLYSAQVDPYADRATRRTRLADAVRIITSTENAGWAKAMLQTGAGQAT
jgi:hypothetical protein